ncbi:MAG TPA: hypothetical protein VFW70_22905 [Methylomirabilota bacterium]|nr:hypothetical protein [Methylomirabilota bacterium]
MSTRQLSHLALTLEVPRDVAPGANRDTQPRVVPPVRVEAGVGVHDPLALLEAGRHRPCRDDRVGVGQILEQQRARPTLGAADAVAAHQNTGRRHRRDRRVETELAREEPTQDLVDIAARLLADERGRAGSALVAQAQPLDRRDERRARGLDGDVAHAATVETPAASERLGQTLGGEILIER